MVRALRLEEQGKLESALHCYKEALADNPKSEVAKSRLEFITTVLERQVCLASWAVLSTYRFLCLAYSLSSIWLKESFLPVLFSLHVVYTLSIGCACTTWTSCAGMVPRTTPWFRFPPYSPWQPPQIGRSNLLLPGMMVKWWYTHLMYVCVQTNKHVHWCLSLL